MYTQYCIFEKSVESNKTERDSEWEKLCLLTLLKDMLFSTTTVTGSKVTKKIKWNHRVGKDKVFTTRKKIFKVQHIGKWRQLPKLRIEGKKREKLGIA